MKVGIDIGTSYSSICFLNSRGKVEPVKVDTGLSIFGNDYSLPSAVFLHNDEFVVGQAACNQRAQKPQNFKSEFKRDFGQNTPYTIGDKRFYPEDLYKELLIYLKKRAEEVTGEFIEQSFITHPATFSKKQKELLLKTGNQAGLLNIELVEEPVAAAYNYLTGNKVVNGETILIYDFGGGTFDAALLRFEDGMFELLTSPVGLERCGGVDFDNEIFQLIQKIANADLSRCADNLKLKNYALAKIKEESVKAKHHLTETALVTGAFDIAMNLVEYELSRDDFNKMISKYVDDSINCISNLLLKTGMQKINIDTIVLVGGSSRVPLVKEKLKQFFKKEIKCDPNPELSIVKGAFKNELIDSAIVEHFDEQTFIQEKVESIDNNINHLDAEINKLKVIPHWKSDNKAFYIDPNRIG